jgi:hypothetical protein
VALLYLGQSDHVGRAVRPEAMTTALQDALIDCDWLPYDVLENDVRIEDGELALHGERYRVLIVPPVEVIPYETLARVREFFEAGGVVVGYDFLPTSSATLGHTSEEIAELRNAIWWPPFGESHEPGLDATHIGLGGGRAYFLPAEVSPEDMLAVLADAGVPPTVEVLEGDTDGWVHALHRRKEGRDVFFVTNQNDQGDARRLTFRLRAPGVPECWDAMRGEVTSPEWRRVDAESVEVTLTLEPLESVLIVFADEERPLPPRIEPRTSPILPPRTLPVREPIQVARVPSPPAENPTLAGLDEPSLRGCNWVWYPEGDARQGVPSGTRYFRKTLALPEDARIRDATFLLTADNAFELYVCGKRAGAGDDWQRVQQLDVRSLLQPGENHLAIAATNGGSGPNPAGLIGRLEILLESGQAIGLPIDDSWIAWNSWVGSWNSCLSDRWVEATAELVAPWGAGPWGEVGSALTLPPVVADPFSGRVTLPADLDLSSVRACLELESLQPEGAARVTVNGHDAGGFVGAPYRLEVTRWLRTGENELTIEPFAPAVARIVIRSRTPPAIPPSESAAATSAGARGFAGTVTSSAAQATRRSNEER